MDAAQTISSAPAADTRGLVAQARSGDEAALNEAAQGFESVFISMLLKEMRQTLEPTTLFGSSGGDVYGGLFDFHLGQHLASEEMLGIGKMLKMQLDGDQRK